MNAAAHVALIERFYAAFAQRDGDAMAACYTPDARFSDPVFTDLRDGEPGDMWRMLCARGRDLEIRLLEHDADDRVGAAHWVASYTFAPTKRHVVNEVEATFSFRDGAIDWHEDRFDLRRWLAQAFGPVGTALGWTPLLPALVRRQAVRELRRFRASDR